MSGDFSKVLIKDDRLHCTDSIRYGVITGGQNVTPGSQFNAVSQGVSNHVYNIQIPSEQTIMDRRVLWRSTVTDQITVTAGPDCPLNYNIFDYGQNAALSPFPLHAHCSTMTATINNNSTTINMNDFLPVILRQLDRKELARYNGYTPNAYDTVKYYQSVVGTNASVLNGWNTSTDNDLNPRGSWVLDSVQLVSGSFTTPAVGPIVAGTALAVFKITYTCTEPLMLSPFIFGNPASNSQGIYGIQNLNFQFQMQPSCRTVRFAPPLSTTAGTINQPSINYAVAPSEFQNSSLIFTFLTPHPSDLLPAKNVVPYYQLSRYTTGSLPVVAAGTGPTSPGVATFTSQSLQLNQIPDKLMIWVRKQLGTQQATDADFFIPISKIRINFNNQSGILSAATKNELFTMSVNNKSNQSWFEYDGKASVRNAAVPGVGGTSIQTSGSLMILEFGTDIQLTETFYAAGSLGNFNLQIQVDVENYDSIGYNGSAAPNNQQLELVVATMESGVYVLERGTSAVYTGILTKQDVIDTASSTPYSGSDVDRLVGGGFLDSLKSVLPKALPVAKSLLGAVDNPYAKGASSVLGALGYAKPKSRLMDRVA